MKPIPEVIKQMLLEALPPDLREIATFGYKAPLSKTHYAIPLHLSFTLSNTVDYVSIHEINRLLDIPPVYCYDTQIKVIPDQTELIYYLKVPHEFDPKQS